MEYEEQQVLKKSEKSTVLLVRETCSGKAFVRKRLKGCHSVYYELQNAPHPYLPVLYGVEEEDGCTVITEEYIPGGPLGMAAPEKQFRSVAKDLCAVLSFLHGKGIIHRDIKPSNILLAPDGHIRLIDFDAARMPKDGAKQDTRLLGTRGYAAPEQYGFAQTDERTDIYALGVTLAQLLDGAPYQARYLPVLRKCMNLDPEKRYQSVRQLEAAFFHRRRGALLGASAFAIALAAFLWLGFRPVLPPQLPLPQNGIQNGMASQDGQQSAPDAPVALPAPDSPHWDGETGTALWGVVPESSSDGNMKYRWRLYCDDGTGPVLVRESSMSGNNTQNNEGLLFEVSFAAWLEKNGDYHFEVAAAGDGVRYADSGYARSDTFTFTGENAPLLPEPTGLQWRAKYSGEKMVYFAVWDNLDEYAGGDSFNVRVYNREGWVVYNNIWTKAFMQSHGDGGIWLNFPQPEDAGDAYRFTVQPQSSRPNNYRSRPEPDPTSENSFSPWLTLQENSGS